MTTRKGRWPGPSKEERPADERIEAARQAEGPVTADPSNDFYARMHRRDREDDRVMMVCPSCGSSQRTSIPHCAMCGGRMVTPVEAARGDGEPSGLLASIVVLGAGTLACVGLGWWLLT